MPLTEVYSFKVSKELKDKMKEYDNINWSSWIRIQIQEKFRELELQERNNPVNFCPRCGKRLIAPQDNFCRVCGAPIPKF